MKTLTPTDLESKGVDLTPDNSNRPTLKGFNGKMVDNCNDGIMIIGDIHWEKELELWSCLANVYGRLCLIEVNVKDLGIPII
jgi:hypothetical protein